FQEQEERMSGMQDFKTVMVKAAEGGFQGALDALGAMATAGIENRPAQKVAIEAALAFARGMVDQAGPERDALIDTSLVAAHFLYNFMHPGAVLTAPGRAAAKGQAEEDRGVMVDKLLRCEET